ncbi:hypothetical protein GGR51DRAFT_568998 [Nemania sp. FL0031]|nr:hypothetical protein GGR51DRAFT_568998 [Nemania sp. FL0031]
MANRFQIDLKTFEISSQALNLSLSMTSVAFIYDVPLNITQDELSCLILSKQLWLLPRGLCRLEVRVQLDECDSTWREEQDCFFDFIADAICDSFLWWQLGLRAEILDVRYHREDDSTPNLYFTIEQSDMSSALLSPPHTNTAHLKGFECILRFKSSPRLEADDINEDLRSEDVSLSSPEPTPPTSEPADHHTPNTPDLIETWGNAAYLVESALCITFGTRQRIQGLRISKLGNEPSLLELAPAIWNSRYLKSTVSHTKNFAVISNILASSLNGQSPELRRKGAEILKDTAGDGIDPYREPERSIKQLESSIQRMLWDLLQSTLKPTIGTKKSIENAGPLDAELDHQYDEIDATMFDGEIVDQCDWNDMHYYRYADLLSSSSQSHDDYQDTISYNTDWELAWQQDDNLILPLQHNQAPEELAIEDEMDDPYYEASVPTYQLFEPYSQNAESDEYYMMQDQMLMSEEMYDGNDDIYGYEYGYTGLMGQESAADELEVMTASYWEKQDEDTIDEGIGEKRTPNLEANEDLL